MKRRAQRQITIWLPKEDMDWLLSEKRRNDKPTVIKEKGGKYALFYRHVKDFPEMETAADRYRSFTKGGNRCRY